MIIKTYYECRLQLMRTILLNVGVFGEHGIDQAALNFLNSIPKNQYKLVLHQIYELDYRSALFEELGNDITVKVAITKNTLLGKIHFNRRKNLLYKIVDGLSLFALNKKIYTSIKECSPDIIIDYDSSLQKVMHKFDIFSMAFIHFSPNELRAGKKASQKRMGARLKQYSKVVLLCEEMRQQAEALWPHLKNYFEVIPNPINLNKIISKSNLSIDFLGNVMPGQYIVSVGRLTAQKNFTLLLHAYKDALTKGVEWPLIIIGDGNEKPQLELIVKKLHLENKVYFTGHLKNPYPYIKNASVFILTSNFEGFGIVLVEAMTLECPVISTICPVGPKDILEDGSCGILVEVGNQEQIATALSHLYSNPRVREDLKVKAKVASAKYDSNEITKKILSLIPA